MNKFGLYELIEIEQIICSLLGEYSKLLSAEQNDLLIKVLVCRNIEVSKAIFPEDCGIRDLIEIIEYSYASVKKSLDTQKLLLTGYMQKIRQTEKRLSVMLEEEHRLSKLVQSGMYRGQIRSIYQLDSSIKEKETEVKSLSQLSTLLVDIGKRKFCDDAGIDYYKEIPKRKQTKV